MTRLLNEAIDFALVVVIVAVTLAAFLLKWAIAAALWQVVFG